MLERARPANDGDGTVMQISITSSAMTAASTEFTRHCCPIFGLFHKGKWFESGLSPGCVRDLRSRNDQCFFQTVERTAAFSALQG
jgi:hypothetical protein